MDEARRMREHERRVQHEMDICVHFTGVQNTACEAGVNLRQLVGGPELGWAARLPCLLMDAEKCAVVCPSRKLPSREEAEAEVRRGDAAVSRTLKAVQAAHADAKS